MTRLLLTFVIGFFAWSVAKSDIVVAADGTGDVKTVQAALERIPENNRKRVVIRIKPGTYVEQVRVPANKPFVSFIGESADTTKLTFNLSNG